MLTKAEQHKPVILQRLKEGRNLAEIADELRLSPHALPHYLEDYKDEGLIVGDGRTVDGLVVDGTEVAFRRNKPCGFPNCERPKKRNSMNQLASKYCAEHLRSYHQLRQKHQRETNTKEFHYSYAEFEAEVLGGARASSKRPALARPSADRQRPAEAAAKPRLPRFSLPEHEPLQATAPPPSHELSPSALQCLKQLAGVHSARMRDLHLEQKVVNTLLSRQFIWVIDKDFARISKRGLAFLSQHVGREQGVQRVEEPPASASSVPPVVAQDDLDELNALLSEYEAQSSASEVRWREIVEGIAVTPTERELPNENGHVSEEVEGIEPPRASSMRPEATEVFVRDVPEWDAEFDITLDTKMNGLEVHVRVAPFFVRDMPVEDVVAYFTSIGTQVGWMLKFHNEG